MHEVLVNRLGGLSLPRKSVVRLTDRPDMTLDVYRGRKTTMQHAKTLLLHEKQLFYAEVEGGILVWARASVRLSIHPSLRLSFVVKLENHLS